MPIDETLSAIASFTTPKGTQISRQSNPVIIRDTSHNLIIINIDRNWFNSAQESYYGGFYIKPSLDLMAVILAIYGSVDTNKTYVFNIAADVALIGNSEQWGAIIGDFLPANAKVRVDNYGLILGRGGNNAVSGGLRGNNDYYLPPTQPWHGGVAAQSAGPNILINNYGGISGGGGGAGQSAEYSHPQVIGTQATEYNSVSIGNITGGAGAPFGNMTRHNADMRDVFIMNPELPWFDGRSATFNPNELNAPYTPEVNYNRYVMCRAAYQSNEIILTDTNINNTRTFRVNNIPSWWADRRSYGLGTAINYVYDYKENTLRNGRPPYNNDPANQGGYLETSTPAGLFRGGSGGNPEVNLMNDLYIYRFIPCMTPAASQVWRDRWRGAAGGNVGKDGNYGNNTPIWTMRLWPKNNPVSYQYLEGAQGTIWNVGPTATNYWTSPASSGAAAGQTKSGNVTIVNMEGGAVGGDQVLAKYDPNGTFDINARNELGNITKTFLPRY